MRNNIFQSDISPFCRKVLKKFSSFSSNTILKFKVYFDIYMYISLNYYLIVIIIQFALHVFSRLKALV